MKCFFLKRRCCGVVFRLLPRGFYALSFLLIRCAGYISINASAGAGAAVTLHSLAQHDPAERARARRLSAANGMRPEAPHVVSIGFQSVVHGSNAAVEAINAGSGDVGAGEGTDGDDVGRVHVCGCERAIVQLPCLF